MSAKRFHAVFCLIAIVLGCDIATAQTESVVHFEPVITGIILKARQTGVKSLTCTIHAFQSGAHTCEKRKVKVAFQNDSVFERRVRLTRDKFVVRNSFVLPYSKDGSQAPAFSPLNVKDSANCKVIWGAAYEGMRDSSHISYCRFTYDSLHREVDYYFTFMSACYQRSTQYEGDSVTIEYTWQKHADTMRLMNTRYTCTTYDADRFPVFRIEKTKNVYNEITFQDSSAYIIKRTFIRYDSYHRITEVREEEYLSVDGKTTGVVTLNTMSVSYD